MTDLQSQIASPLFKKVEGGWVFRAPNAWIFGRAQHYLVNDAQRAAIHSIVTPRRPMLAIAVLIAVLLSVIATVIGAGILIYGDADELTPTGIFALLVAALFLLYLALLISSRMRIRWLKPALDGLPTTDQSITSADMRQAITSAMSVNKLLFISMGYAFSCLAGAATVAITRNPLHSVLSAESGLFLFNTALFGALAIYYFRKLFERLWPADGASQLTDQSLTRRQRLIAIAAAAGFLGLASIEAYIGVKREFSDHTQGLRHQAKGESKLAIADFTRSIEGGNADAATYAARAKSYAATGDHERAIADYTKAIALKPDDSFAYFYRALSYAAKGRYDLAIDDLTGFIALHPTAAYAYQARGFDRAAKGDHDGAIADLTRSLELRPGHARAYQTRAASYAAKGDQDGAIADLTKAIEIDPKLAYAYQARGIALASKREHDRAIADFTKGIELNPGYANFYYFRSISYAAKGDHDQAIVGLNRYIELKPNDPFAYEARGRSLAAKGENDRAISDYRRIIELPASSPAEVRKQDNARTQIARLTKLQSELSLPSGGDRGGASR